MAPRDRNLFAWQAYVIAMSFVVVGLLVALGFSIASVSNETRSKDEAVKQKASADKTNKELQSQLEYIKGMLGQRQFTEAEWNQAKSASADPQSEALLTQYNKDMSLFGPNEPIQNRNYPKLAEHLIREVRARNSQVDAQAKAQADLTKKMENDVKNETAAREAAQKKTAETEKRLAAETIDNQKKLDDAQKTISEVNATLQKTISVANAEKAKHDATEKQIKIQNNELVARNLSLVERVRVLEGEDFQSAQGKIIGVLGRDGNIVDVNLGSADGLRPGVRFGIVNPNELRLKDATPKAHVEITKIRGPHEASGQVISGSLQFPVLFGDLVYSVAWEKGRKVQFALLGKLDIDGNGSDDRQTIKDLIIQNGGEIVEDLGPDGKKTGTGMTVDTRWLVVGEGFKVSATEDLDPTQVIFRKQYAEMQKRAKELAVSQMNTSKLLNWIQGGNKGDRSIPLGSAIRATDHTDSRRVPSGDGTVAEIYMNRKESGPFTPAKGVDVRNP